MLFRLVIQVLYGCLIALMLSRSMVRNSVLSGSKKYSHSSACTVEADFDIELPKSSYMPVDMHWFFRFVNFLESIHSFPDIIFLMDVTSVFVMYSSSVSPGTLSTYSSSVTSAINSSAMLILFHFGVLPWIAAILFSSSANFLHFLPGVISYILVLDWLNLWVIWNLRDVVTTVRDFLSAGYHKS